MKEDSLQCGYIHDISGNRSVIKWDACRTLNNKYQPYLIADNIVMYILLCHPEMDTVGQASAVYEDVFVSTIVFHYIFKICFLEYHLLFRCGYGCQEAADALACQICVRIQESDYVSFIPVNRITVGKPRKSVKKKHGMQSIRIPVSYRICHIHQPGRMKERIY